MLVCTPSSAAPSRGIRHPPSDDCSRAIIISDTIMTPGGNLMYTFRACCITRFFWDLRYICARASSSWCPFYPVARLAPSARVLLLGERPRDILSYRTY